MKSVIIIIIALFIAPGADAFTGCGTLMMGAEPGCVLFDADQGGIYLVDYTGSFQIGDYVYIEGNLDPGCFTFCMDNEGCLSVDTIEACVDPYFKGCGTLTMGAECVLFAANQGGVYVIDNMGGFQIGDNVYIEGTIDPDCDTFCMQGDGCLYVDTIENCFFPYSDCGTLVQDLDCILFQPDNGYKYLLVDPQFNIMTDFGDYEIGDRFRVVGSFVSVWDSLCMNQMGTIRVEALGDMGCNCIGIRGNIDGDILDAIDISDVVYLVNFLFFYDNPPINIEEADVNGSGGTVPVDITDLTYMVNYLFQGGPPPLDCP